MAKRKKGLGEYLHNKSLLIIVLILLGLGSLYYFSVKTKTTLQDSVNLPSAYQEAEASGTVNTIFNNGSEKGSMVPVALAGGNSRVLFYLEYAGFGNNPSNPHAYNIISYNLATGESFMLNGKTPVDAPVEITSSSQGYMIYSSGGNLVRVHIETGKSTQITSSYMGPYPISISPNGQKIAFFESEGKSRVAAVYDIAKLEKEKSYAVSSDTINNRIIWSSSGGVLYVVNIRIINGLVVNDIMEFSDKYPQGSIVINTDTAKSQISFQPNSGKLLYIENASGSEESNLVEYDLDTNQSRILETGQTGYNSFSGYVISSDREKMYFTRADQGLTEMGLTGGKKVTLLSQVQSTPYLRLIGFGNNENELVISNLATTKEGKQKEFYKVYNVSTNELSEITSSDVPSKGY